MFQRVSVKSQGVVVALVFLSAAFKVTVQDSH